MVAALDAPSWFRLRVIRGTPQYAGEVIYIFTVEQKRHRVATGGASYACEPE